MSYQALTQHHHRLFQLRHVEAILSWDESAMMPTGGGPARAEALAELRGLIHHHATDEKLADLFAAASQETTRLSPWDAANLREMQREWVRATALPQDLVMAMSKAESQSEQAWRTLRAANDFPAFLPLFREVIRLKRLAAQALGEKLSLTPYDALIDGFDPGSRVETIQPVFKRLRAFLPGFIEKVLTKQTVAAAATGPFPEDRQRWLGLELMEKIGFDFNHGRLDKSHHPFCGGMPTDVRLTTRYNEIDFARSLFGVLHETGHAKYEQNLPRNWLGQPVGSPRGMSIHESQSLFWEMQVCRGRAFLEFAAPFVKKAFPDRCASEPARFTPDSLYSQLTQAKRSYIRVDADEVTYPCHIILRFELERDLIAGALSPNDVPEAWDQHMRELLQISTLGNDRDGCMQDVHWPAGLFGYFPSYTLGALTAAQLFRAAKSALPGLLEDIRRGHFQPLDAWLRENIWSQGSFLSTPDLVKRATGAELGSEAFEEHLHHRYLARES